MGWHHNVIKRGLWGFFFLLCFISGTENISTKMKMEWLFPGKCLSLTAGYFCHAQPGYISSYWYPVVAYYQLSVCLDNLWCTGWNISPSVAARAAQGSVVGRVHCNQYREVMWAGCVQCCWDYGEFAPVGWFHETEKLLKVSGFGFGKIYLQHFPPTLFNDFVFKFQSRKVCAKWDLFFSLLLDNSSCSVQGTLRKMIYFSKYIHWIKVLSIY